MQKSDKIYVAGHRGMVGSAVVRRLEEDGYSNLLCRTRQEVDLCEQAAVRELFAAEKPDVVVLAAAKVGGIHANSTRPAEFIYENLQVQNNVIHTAYQAGVKKFCFLGSSCIYPRECPQPMKEESLLTGPLEPTNEGYAIAKIAGLKMAYYYAKQYGMNIISLMPCNLYGTNDDFDLETCHVLSALVKRFSDAVESGADRLTLWGTGVARREFLHVDDLAYATVRLLEEYNEPEFVNVGSGTDISIHDLADKIAKAAGYQGEICWDSTKPDGMPLKCLDVTRLRALGIEARIDLDRGIGMMLEEYRQLKQGG